MALDFWRVAAGAVGAADEVRRIHGAPRRFADQVDALFDSTAVLATALDGPSGDAYAWMRRLADDDHLHEHVRALERARRATALYEGRCRFPARILLGTTTSIWRARDENGGSVLQANQAFARADDEIWRALIAAALVRGGPKRNRTVRAFADSPHFVAVHRELAESLPKGVSPARGKHRDLDQAFDRVNSAYFDGRLERPALAWSRVDAATVFGTYVAGRDLVTLSRRLDDAAVPEYVLEFILYHELLHKVHGAEDQDGKRCVHTRAFRADERRFQEADAAEAVIKNLARRRSAKKRRK